MSNQPCSECGAVEKEGTWWSLSNYFGLSGYFCPSCYDKVSHDGYKNPRNPAEYTMILLRRGLQK